MRPVVVALALALTWPALSVDPTTGAIPVARADAAAVQVGDVLQATEDVSLDEAVIREGSKISVSKKAKVAGRVVLDVVLADGHVVRGVSLTAILKSFRRAE